ncbi:hypothetical protein B0H19DRAFT_1352228 [Mycena capillaripes]|nr:hypothetical protein B0H19DRAFT_1352228 [Mycena capillaripes]
MIAITAESSPLSLYHASPTGESSLSDAFKELARTFQTAERASTFVQSKLEALETERDAAQKKLARMATELEAAKAQALQAQVALTAEMKARIGAEDALRAMKTDLEAREARIQVDEDEMRKYRQAMEEDLQSMVRKMRDTTDRHVKRLSVPASKDHPGGGRPCPESSAEPLAKRIKLEDSAKPAVNAADAVLKVGAGSQAAVETAGAVMAKISAPSTVEAGGPLPTVVTTATGSFGTGTTRPCLKPTTERKMPSKRPAPDGTQAQTYITGLIRESFQCLSSFIYVAMWYIFSTQNICFDSTTSRPYSI